MTKNLYPKIKSTKKLSHLRKLESKNLTRARNVLIQKSIV